MNIQQYMTPEVVGPLTFISILFVAFLSTIQISKLSKIAELYYDGDETIKEEQTSPEVTPFVRKPQSGEFWYPRMSVGCPWAVETDPVRIIEVRNGWLQYSDKDDNLSTIKTDQFITIYMRDDYGDFKPQTKTVVSDDTIKEELKDERLEEMGFNVIKIHGEDFVLHPLEKKNDQ